MLILSILIVLGKLAMTSTQLQEEEITKETNVLRAFLANLCFIHDIYKFTDIYLVVTIFITIINNLADVFIGSFLWNVMKNAFRSSAVMKPSWTG